MKNFKTAEELYKILNDAIESRANGTISEELFSATIDNLNKNPFGIVIDKNIIVSNRDNFNEDEDTSYDEYDEDSSYSY